MTHRQIFLQHVGQTSPSPLALEIVKAQGNYLFDVQGKRYIDIIGGISVCNVGHANPRVVQAVQEQAANYMHVMVNGELVLTPQTAFASLLTRHLPPGLDCVFFTTSGSEATEAAMKLAKRFTGRTQIAAFNHSYHGSSQGAMSIMGSEYWRNAYRPLLPGIRHLNYNSFDDLEQIDRHTACVIAETIQSEAGVIVPKKEWLQALRQKCDDTGALLVLDEIQCGFGRNGTLWAFEQFDVTPDVLLLGKAMGGGMPMGGLVSSREIMNSFTENPVLGHMNTFGGHPVCCAAGLAALEYLLEEKLTDQVFEKEKIFLDRLHSPHIQAIRSRGLMLAIEFENFEKNKLVIDRLIEDGVFTDWFLFAPNCLRMVPPLTITPAEIETVCDKMLRILTDLE